MERLAYPALLDTVLAHRGRHGWIAYLMNGIAMSDRTGLVTTRPKVDVIMARDWTRDPSTGRWVNSGPWNGWAIYYNGQLIADVDKCQLNEAMTYARVVAKSETEPELSDLDSGGYWVVDAEELDEWYEEFVENLSA